MTHGRRPVVYLEVQPTRAQHQRMERADPVDRYLYTPVTRKAITLLVAAVHQAIPARLDEIGLKRDDLFGYLTRGSVGGQVPFSVEM